MVVALDESSSMRTTDPSRPVGAVQSLRDALKLGEGEDPATFDRLRIARGLLGAGLIERLTGEHEVEALTFAAGGTPGSPDTLLSNGRDDRRPDDYATNWGAAVEAALRAGGVQFKNGATLKFKYHITNFHDQGFTEEVDGVEVKPYDGLNANVIYVSLGYGLFKKKDFWKGMGKGSGGSTGRPQNTDM